MRTLLPLSVLLLAGLAGSAEAQTRRASTAPTTLTVTVVDGTGQALAGVTVRALGPTLREGTSGEDGTVKFSGVRPGDYRLRFLHEGFITFEKETTVRGGTPAKVEATLTAAPAPSPAPEPEPAPAAAAPVTDAPPGDAKSIDVPGFAERNLISREPTKLDELGCTASARTSLLQVRDSVPERALEDQDEVLYVVAGDGTLRLGNRDVSLGAGMLAIVPRGTVRGLERRGRNPLILLSVLSGTPCTAP